MPHDRPHPDPLRPVLPLPPLPLVRVARGCAVSARERAVAVVAEAVRRDLDGRAHVTEYLDDDVREELFAGVSEAVVAALEARLGLQDESHVTPEWVSSPDGRTRVVRERRTRLVTDWTITREDPS